MAWWIWLVLGMALLGGEMAMPGGFYLLFFGVGALLVGFAVLFAPGLAGWVEWLLFSVLSIGLLAFLRPKIVGRLRQAGPGIEDTLVGEVAVAAEPIAPGAIGRGELRGSAFSLRNAGPDPLAPGERCRVSRVDGLTLEVQRESARG